MNRIILSIVFIANFAFLNAFSFNDVDSLIQKRQFLDAWKCLEKKENDKNKSEINIEKIDFCLKYFTKTVSHQAFAFTNLKPGQRLIEQRRIAETKMVPVTPFEINIIVDSLIKEEPKNYKLYKAKGDYYYDIFILYGKDWIQNRQEVLRQMFTAYNKADEHGVNDYLSLYALGYFYNLNEQSNHAIKYFNRSLELDSTYAPTHYNLAYLYTERDSNEVALYHAWQAYQGYKYLNYKNDAGQMTGSLLAKLGRHEEAISILLDCDKLMPNTYHTYYYLLNSFLALNRMKEALVLTENMFYLDWKSHTVNTDIIEFFVKNNQLEELINFYDTRLDKEKYDMEFRGHTQLHMAQAYSLVNNTEKVKEFVSKARESFNICYDPGHPVFGVLNNMVK